MKNLISIMLLCMLTASLLAGCSSEMDEPAPTATPVAQEANFAPQTTAVVTSSLAQALASVSDDEEAPADDAAAEEQPVAEDSAAEQEPVVDTPAEAAPTPEPTVEDEVTEETTGEESEEAQDRQPYATATPQPNASISSYASVTASHLMFQFSYPQGWNNIPGRSTVCYVQPMEEGTVYPARVAVSMKEISHNGTEERLQEQFMEFFETLMSQYDENTFEAEEDLDTGSDFMGGRRSLATTYLAYDGDQEIKGYVAMTYFEKYVFCYHFQCAFTDYEAFESAIMRMRDSVSPYQETAEE